VAPKKKNSPTSASEIILWLLFVALIFPAAFAGYAVGHYTSLGKPPKTVTVTTSGGGGTQSTTTSGMTTTSSSGGNLAVGKAAFASAGCAGCHTFQPANSNGSLGPNLDTAPTADAKDAKMALDAFIKESITNPSAYISKAGNWSVQMPGNFGTSLTPTQIDGLVAFIASGQQ
jgi:mono/diheme cytochrome c family protein